MDWFLGLFIVCAIIAIFFGIDLKVKFTGLGETADTIGLVVAIVAGASIAMAGSGPRAR